MTDATFDDSRADPPQPHQTWSPPAWPPPAASGQQLVPPVAATRLSEGRARTVTDPRERRMLGWETIVVLGVFPLTATLTAIAFLVAHLVGGPTFNNNLIVNSSFNWSAALDALITLGDFAAAGLVIFLLYRSRETLRSIGLSRRGFRRDLALLLPVWVFTQAIPQDIGSHIVTGLHWHSFAPLSPPTPAIFLIAGLLTSLSAAVVEEIVVLGYLVRRLEQRGWSPAVVVLVALAVRVSYHVYYGPAVVPVVLWAFVTLLLYLRFRRLLPFIICHFVWDAHIFIHQYSSTASNIFTGAFFVFALIACPLWLRQDAPIGAPLVQALA
ncbi:MAG TPA: CPBP family glutamic-type intramembrane protease [Acidimicrobiales bacterium]|jgi:hypothetical protein